MKIINFRVDDAEHQLMHALASAAGMTLSGYIRQHFRVLALEKGLVRNPLDALRVQPESPATSEKPQKPAVEHRPKPAGTLYREEIMKRIDSGESYAAVAASYGVSVSEVRQKYEEAQIAIPENKPAWAHLPSCDDLIDNDDFSRTPTDKPATSMTPADIDLAAKLNDLIGDDD